MDIPGIDRKLIQFAVGRYIIESLLYSNDSYFNGTFQEDSKLVRVLHKKSGAVNIMSNYRLISVTVITLDFSNASLKWESIWFVRISGRQLLPLQRLFMQHQDLLCIKYMIQCTQSAKLMYIFMMTSSNGNIFRVTGHLCGEFTGHRWIPRTRASDAELWCFRWSAFE